MSFAGPVGRGRSHERLRGASLQLPPARGFGTPRSQRSCCGWSPSSLVVLDARRRRAEHPARETVRPEWFVPLRSASAAAGRRRHLQGGLGAEDLEGEEVWIDV